MHVLTLQSICKGASSCSCKNSYRGLHRHLFKSHCGKRPEPKHPPEARPGAGLTADSDDDVPGGAGAAPASLAAWVAAWVTAGKLRSLTAIRLHCHPRASRWGPPRAVWTDLRCHWTIGVPCLETGVQYGLEPPQDPSLPALQLWAPLSMSCPPIQPCNSAPRAWTPAGAASLPGVPLYSPGAAF